MVAKRKRLQFSLATLLLVTAAFAVGVAFWRPAKTNFSFEVWSDISLSDLRQIEALVAKLTDRPILLIRDLGSGEIQVEAGEKRGRYGVTERWYVFAKKDGKWAMTREGVWSP